MDNNTFNIKRFALLAKKDAIENWKYNFIFSITLFAVLLGVMIYTIDKYTNKTQSTIDTYLNYELISVSIMIFCFSFMFYISTMMRPMSNKKKRINYLMLPASSLEKFLVRFIPCTIGFILVFFLCFFLADLARVVIGSIFYSEMELHLIKLSETLVNDNNRDAMFNSHLFKLTAALFTMLLSLFVFGTTLWQKHVFINNFLSVASLVVLFSFTVHKLCMYLSVEGDYNGNAFLHPGTFFRHTTVTITAFTLISVFFCVLAYFRFKESEFIERK